MTLREYIQEHISLDKAGYPRVFERLAEHIISIHPEWSEKKDVLKTYKRVCMEIEDLPGDDELKGHVIVIEDVENTLFEKTESWVDVHLLDADGDKWSLDMTDWNGLVDLEIKDDSSRTMEKKLAHVLYEITFWGTTRAAVIHESRQLEKLARDKDNLIEVTMEEFLAECDSLK